MTTSFSDCEEHISIYQYIFILQYQYIYIYQLLKEVLSGNLYISWIQRVATCQFLGVASLVGTSLDNPVKDIPEAVYAAMLGFSMYISVCPKLIMKPSEAGCHLNLRRQSSNMLDFQCCSWEDFRDDCTIDAERSVVLFHDELCFILVHI